MKTLTVTEAATDLGKWLDAALRGEEIQIKAGDALVALQPVDDGEPTEYAKQEYGVTKADLDAFERRMDAEIEQSRRDGTLITIEDPTVEKFEEAIRSFPHAAQTAERAPGE